MNDLNDKKTTDNNKNKIRKQIQHGTRLLRIQQRPLLLQTTNVFVLAKSTFGVSFLLAVTSVRSFGTIEA